MQHPAIPTVLLALILAAPATAAEYVVATDGDDGNDGISAPLASLWRGVQLAEPGDVVTVRAGTYHYSRTPSLRNADGGPDNRILLRGEPGAVVILDGSRSPSDSDAFFCSGGAYYTIENLTVRNVRRIGINYWGGGHHITIRDCTFHTMPGGAVWMRRDHSSHLRFERNTVYDCCRNNADFQWGHAGGWPSAVNLAGDGCAVIDCRIHENFGEGIGCYGQGPIIRGNVLHDNYSVEIYINNVSDAVIEGNFIYTTGNRSFFRRWGDTFAAAIGLEMANEAASDTRFARNVVRNNIVVGDERLWHLYWWSGPGGGGLVDSLIAHNVFAGASASGVFHLDAGAHSGTRIVDNIFHASGSGVLHDASSTAGLGFSHNCWSGGDAGIASSSGDVLANPLFVEEGGATPGSYGLSADSPCRGAGLLLTEVADDFAGRQRSAPTDIGAFHHSDDSGNAAPQITGLTADDDPVDGTGTTLRASATDDGGAAELTWGWRVLAQPAGAVPPAFSRNGSTDAATTRVTFAAFGSYRLELSVSDVQGARDQASIDLEVVQQASGLRITTP